MSNEVDLKTAALMESAEGFAETLAERFNAGLMAEDIPAKIRNSIVEAVRTAGTAGFMQGWIHARRDLRAKGII